MSVNVLRIAAAQLKFRASIAENVELIRRSIASAVQKKCDAVLFPECTITGYNVDFREVGRREIERGLKSIGEAARDSSINVLIGSPTFRGRTRFNSLVHFDRQGRER